MQSLIRHAFDIEVQFRTAFGRWGITEFIQKEQTAAVMQENLIQVLPEQRRSILRHECSLLHKTTERSVLEPEDRALAEVSDSRVWVARTPNLGHGVQ